jgi:hypothetical protein
MNAGRHPPAWFPQPPYQPGYGFPAAHRYRPGRAPAHAAPDAATPPPSPDDPARRLRTHWPRSHAGGARPKRVWVNARYADAAGLLLRASGPLGIRLDRPALDAWRALVATFGDLRGPRMTGRVEFSTAAGSDAVAIPVDAPVGAAYTPTRRYLVFVLAPPRGYEPRLPVGGCAFVDGPDGGGVRAGLGDGFLLPPPSSDGGESPPAGGSRRSGGSGRVGDVPRHPSVSFLNEPTWIPYQEPPDAEEEDAQAEGEAAPFGFRRPWQQLSPTLAGAGMRVQQPGGAFPWPPAGPARFTPFAAQRHHYWR